MYVQTHIKLKSMVGLSWKRITRPLHMYCRATYLMEITEWASACNVRSREEALYSHLQ